MTYSVLKVPLNPNQPTADDLVVIAETVEDLIKKLNEWKNNVENKGMRVNMNKTKIMISGERQKPLQKAVWCMWQRCWYLVVIQYNVPEMGTGVRDSDSSRDLSSYFWDLRLACDLLVMT